MKQKVPINVRRTPCWTLSPAWFPYSHHPSISLRFIWITVSIYTLVSQVVCFSVFPRKLMSLLIRLPLHYLIKNPHYDITHYVIFSFTYLVLSGLFYTVFLSNLIPVRLQFVIYLESPISFYFKGEIKFLFCLFSFFVTARECVLKHGDVHRIRGQAWGI